MRKLIFTLLIGLISSVNLLAAGTDHYETIFETANQLYDNGEFEEAKNQYLQILNAGYVSPDLNYNLANAYYKLGSYPAAILYYEKCLKLDPGNADAKYNLNLTNKMIIDKIDSLPTIFYKRWWQSMRNSNSLDGWATLLIVFVFAMATSFFLFNVSGKSQIKRLAFYGLLLFTVGAVYTTIMSVGLYKHIHSQEDAIVFEPTLNVQSAPSSAATTLYVIHEGTKVTLIETKDSWANIALPDGNEGWVPTETLETI